MKKKSDAKRMAAKALKSEMRQEMMGGLPEKMKGKMAVKVVADSPEELKKGLEKAEDVLEDEESEDKCGGGMASMLKEAFKARSKKPKKEE